MASSSRSEFFSVDKDSLIEQFSAVTGADEEKAIRMLEVCSWNLEMAINMHVDSDCQEDTNNRAAKDSRHARKSKEAEDPVRPPILPARAVLVEGNYPSDYGASRIKRRTNFIYDGFRDFQAETRWQEMELEEREKSGESYKKRKTLEDLFRPPLDLIYRGSFESARDAGQVANKWLLVNIQNTQEFACQVLNRDVWSNTAVRSIISEHFVFWQVYADSAEGERYMQFYSPVVFPYVAIIDPRTGENLVVWNKLDAVVFCDNVTAFLTEHDVPCVIVKNDQSEKSDDCVCLLDESEEQQLKAATEASLKEVSSTITIDDEEDSSDIETFESDSDSQHANPSPVSNPGPKDSNSGNETQDCCTSSSGDSNTSNSIVCVDNEEDWQSYLGSKEDEMTDLVLRLPDGQKKRVTWPCTSKIKALILYSETLGFIRGKYELITNFPRKNISEVPHNKTLKEIGLYPREMIFIQLKNNSS